MPIKVTRPEATKIPGIVEIGPERFLVRARWTDERTGRRMKREGVAKTFAEAVALKERWGSERDRSARAEGAGPIASRVSTRIGGAATAWVEEITTRRHERDPRQLHLCPSTAAKYRGVVRDFIVPSRLAELFVDRVTKDDVRCWRREQLDAGYASATVNSNFAVLQSVLRSAGNSGAADLPSLSTKQDARTNRREPNKLTEDELDRFLAGMLEHHRDRYAATLMLFTTTLRPGALLALRMEDLDLEQMEVVSQRRLSRGVIVPGVKADRFGEDTPPLLPEVYKAILELREEYNEKQLESGLVFPAKDGGHHDRQWLAKAFKDVCERVGITKRFTPTGARRTGETWYGRTAGTRIAMAITGHRTEAMHRHYGGADAAEKQAMAAKTWGAVLRDVGARGGAPLRLVHPGGTPEPAVSS